ncbi:MAG: hypothetical protein P8Y47_05220 [Alphaproteobacteria bacterium]
MYIQKTLTATAMIAALGISGSAYAADLGTGGSMKDEVYVTHNYIKDVNNEVAVYFISTDFDYNEYSGGELLDSETDWVSGGAISASLMRNWIVDNFYLYGQFSMNSGETKYTGSYIGSNAGYGSVVDKSDADVWDLDLRVGKGFQLQQNLMVTPYLGMGWHEWDRGVNQGEVYSHSYIGAGLLVQYSPLDRFVVSASGLIGKTYNSEIDIAGPVGFKDDLGNSTIYKLGLEGDYAVTRNLHLKAGVEYVNFDYGKSDSHNGYYEPDSETENLTVKAGIGYTLGSDHQPLK